MSALRQRRIEDLQVRNYSARTVVAYVAAVAKLAKHFRKPPDVLSGEEIRAFQVHLLAQQVSWSQFNQIVSGLRFLYGTTLLRPGMVEMRPKRLPTVLSVEEVGQILETARPGRERVLLQTAYACGLRINELLNLQVTDIDSARMVVNVGLRCPSELNALTWPDVNWQTNRIVVRSPKTGTRVIPLFPTVAGVRRACRAGGRARHREVRPANEPADAVSQDHRAGWARTVGKIVPQFKK